MPLGKGVRYRFKKGTDVRLAFKGDRVIEAKNTRSGATHTPEEFAAERQPPAERPPKASTRAYRERRLRRG